MISRPELYPYPVSNDEPARLVALDSMNILDTPPQPFFDAIVFLASCHFGCPIVAVSLIAENRQWFKAMVGLDVCETERDVAFCNFTILGPEVFVVEDASLDERFLDNPLVKGPPSIRFYAGYPISPDGVNRLGSLCIIDDKPRSFSDADRLFLSSLGRIVEALLRSHTQALELDAAVEKSRLETAELGAKNSLLLQAERIAGIGVWTLDVATGLVTWSDEIFRLHDMPAGKQPTADQALAFYAGSERSLVSGYIRQCIETQMPFEFEVDMVSAAGRARTVRSSGEAVTKKGHDDPAGRCFAGRD